MAVRVPRIDASKLIAWPSDLPSGGLGWVWWDNPEGDFVHILLVRCPHGHWAAMSTIKHGIAADGTVSPSVHFMGLCGTLPDFHEYCVLEGWTEEDGRMYATST